MFQFYLGISQLTAYSVAFVTTVTAPLYDVKEGRTAVFKPIVSIQQNMSYYLRVFPIMWLLHLDVWDPSLEGGVLL